VKEHGWKRAFDDPIPLPDGRVLVTLKDAGADRRHEGAARTIIGENGSWREIR
jgi:hypothetical protein